jgi:hypothetical protein
LKNMSVGSALYKIIEPPGIFCGYQLQKQRDPSLFIRFSLYFIIIIRSDQHRTGTD